MKRKCHIVFAALLVFATPSVALANAGTPLMWATAMHLLFGNLLIGLLEGALLAMIFRVPWWRAILLMIFANYFSAWVGLFVIQSVVDACSLNLNNARRFFWGMLVATYLFTLLLEFPCVALAFFRDRRWFPKAIVASLIVQTVSYALLIGWYRNIIDGDDSLYTQNQIVDVSQMSLPAHVIVRYISAADGDWYEISLTERRPRKLFDLDASPRTPDAHMNFGMATRLGDASNSPWEFHTGFWPDEGLQGVRKDTGRRVRLAYETPFGQWFFRNAIHLPGDIVLFQLGEDQICVFDPNKHQVTLLVRGRGVAATMRDDAD